MQMFPDSSVRVTLLRATVSSSNWIPSQILHFLSMAETDCITATAPRACKTGKLEQGEKSKFDLKSLGVTAVSLLQLVALD